MRCDRCGATLLAGKPFCHACGAPAAQTCAGCGAKLAPEFRFCPDCGRAVADAGDAAPAAQPAGLASRMPAALAEKIRAAQGVTHGERKVVTVISCDLVGSTAIAEQLDPEDYHDLLDRYVEGAFGAIYRFEGIVTQLAGDGILAVFGAPLAHEDAPDRAILAALSIHEALATLAPPELAGKDLALSARIGIHTGPVVVDTIGTDLRMDYTAVGDTTHLAVRLEAQATPGTTLVSEATERLVRGVFELEPRAGDPMGYEVVGMVADPGAARVAAGRDMTPLVGRRAELTELEAAYQRLESGAAQIVVVIGEAGRGKSRLLWEFRRRLAVTPAVVFEGRCTSLGHAVPYAPFVGMFRRAAESDPAAARLTARLLAPPDAADAEAGEDARRPVFDAVAELVLDASTRGPVVMILEDVHAIDDASRELLESLSERLRGAPLLTIVSRRPEGATAWSPTSAYSQLLLPRLADGDIRAIIEAVAGGPVPSELEVLLVARAGGSPFFAEELTRALLESGALVADGDARRLTVPLAEVRLPDTVQEVIAARLDRLDPAAKRVVQVAAVLGRQLLGRHLVALLDGEDVDVRDALARLEQRGIFHRKNLLAGDEYRFGESLTQEVAYEGLLLRQRRLLHERIAAMLDGESDEPTVERSALVAHHYARSENREQAVAALLRAAGDAERVPSYRTAAEFYRQAWELAEAAEPTDEAGRRAALAAARGFATLTALFSVADVRAAERAAERGRALAESLGDLETLAGLLYFHGILLMARDRDHFAPGLALAEESLAVAERAGSRLVGMRLSRGLVINYLHDGRFELARRTIDWLLGELVPPAERARHPDLHVSASSIRALVHFLSDDLDAALGHATDTYALTVERENRTVRCGVTATLAQLHLLRGRYEEAKRWADESLELAEAIGNPSGFAGAAAVALRARTLLGEAVVPTRWVSLIEQGLPAGSSPPIAVRFVGDALLAVGETERLARLATAMHQRAGGRLREAFVTMMLGGVASRQGRRVLAERWYRTTLALAESVGARSMQVGALVGLAELGGPDASAHRERALAGCRELGLVYYATEAERAPAVEGSVAG